MQKKVQWLKLSLLLVGVGILFFAAYRSTFVRSLFSNPEVLRSLVLRFGIFAPLGLILLQVFQTVVSIVPSEITTIVGGFIFGPILGIVYTAIGTFLGSFLVFLAGRKYGKEFVGGIFSKRDIVHFNLFFRQRGLWALFLVRVAPFFPNDVVSFAAGLTTIEAWKFNLVSTLGFMVEIVLLTFFGSELSQGKVSVSLLVIGGFLAILLLVGLCKHQIRKILIKDLSLLEKEGKEAEKFIEKEFKKI